MLIEGTRRTEHIFIIKALNPYPYYKVITPFSISCLDFHTICINSNVVANTRPPTQVQ